MQRRKYGVYLACLLASAAVLGAGKSLWRSHSLPAERNRSPLILATAQTARYEELLRANRGRDSEADGKREGEGHEADNAEGMALERYLKRLDSKGRLDRNDLLLAKKHAERMSVAVWYDPRQRKGVHPLDAGITGWEWLGPGNIGGRIRSIVFTDANTLLIGATSGGIWRSPDKGASWAPMTDFLASLEVSSMTIDPTNTNTIYAGTGEGFTGAVHASLQFVPGVGIFKSTNGGFNWTQLAATTSWQYVYRVTHDPIQTGVLYAATSSGLFKTTDGGARWNNLLPTLMLDVKVDPANPQRVLAGNSGNVYLSINGGANWTVQTTGGTKLPNNGGRSEVAFGVGGAMWVSMNRNGGEVWRSTNSGANWILQNTGLNYLSQGEYANDIWASPDDSNLVVVGGLDLWRSTNGGVNFTQISDWTQYHPPTQSSAHSDQHAIAAPPDYGAGNRALYFGNDGGIQRVASIYAAQVQWSNLANGLGITQFYGGAAFPTGAHIIGGAQDNDTSRFRPQDGANAWYQFQTGDGGFCAYDPQNIFICYKEYVNLAIEKSTDGGDTYFPNNFGLNDATNKTCLFIAPFVMDPSNSSYLAAGGASLWRTTNAGANWGSIRGPRPSLLNPNPPPPTLPVYCSALAIGADSANDIWAGYTDGTISHTINNDVTQWIDVQGNSATHPPARWITDIAINPKNANQVFVTVGGGGSDSVWFTQDNGLSWQQRTGNGTASLPAVQTNTIVFHPDDPGLVYVGTDIGVFASDNKGVTWSRTPLYAGTVWNNEGPANVEVSRLFWQGSYLIAATFGRGMFRTLPYLVIYVDQTNNGPQDGSSAHPYKTVRQATDAAVDGTLIVIRSADYKEGYSLVKKHIRIVAENGVSRVH